MPISILSLNKTIESFNEGIALRVFGIISVMDNASFFKILIEVFMELLPVVGLNGSDVKEADLLYLLHEVTG